MTKSKKDVISNDNFLGKMSNGIIYIAFGKKYVEDAKRSALSLRRYLSNIHITLYTDLALDSSLFNEIINKNTPRYLYLERINILINSPYNDNLFLDSDTYISGDITDIFTLLEKFDVALAHAPYRKIYEVKEVPDSFPEFNCGVIGFRKSKIVRNLFLNWRKIYKRDLNRNIYNPKDLKVLKNRKCFHDQTSLREAIYFSNIRIATLTPEYNCRCNNPIYLHGKAKIIHVNNKNIERIENKLNKNEERRIFIPNIGVLNNNSLLIKFFRKLC